LLEKRQSTPKKKKKRWGQKLKTPPFLKKTCGEQKEQRVFFFFFFPPFWYFYFTVAAQSATPTSLADACSVAPPNSSLCLAATDLPQIRPLSLSQQNTVAAVAAARWWWCWSSSSSFLLASSSSTSQFVVLTPSWMQQQRQLPALTAGCRRWRTRNRRLEHITGHQAAAVATQFRAFLFLLTNQLPTVAAAAKPGVGGEREKREEAGALRGGHQLHSLVLLLLVCRSYYCCVSVCDWSVGFLKTILYCSSRLAAACGWVKNS
jgi:hypothetical protein